jgi:hypothetical protein
MRVSDATGWTISISDLEQALDIVRAVKGSWITHDTGTRWGHGAVTKHLPVNYELIVNYDVRVHWPSCPEGDQVNGDDLLDAGYSSPWVSNHWAPTKALARYLRVGKGTSLTLERRIQRWSRVPRGSDALPRVTLVAQHTVAAWRWTGTVWERRA